MFKGFTELIRSFDGGDFVAFFALIGGLIGFVVWDRRRKQLEIEKLRLEIARLKHEPRIYQPTHEEIQRVLRVVDDVRDFLGPIGGDEPFIDFASDEELKAWQEKAEQDDEAIEQFLNRFSIYLEKVIAWRSDTTGSIKSPDPLPIYEQWKAVRPIALSFHVELDTDALMDIDFLLRSLAGDKTGYFRDGER